LTVFQWIIRVVGEYRGVIWVDVIHIGLVLVFIFVVNFFDKVGC
jgi:hypothetical protein